ncbi:phosphotransferase enzyme family protein [Planomonospora venezuelensis]|uniref:Ser/Thr protein kinase RdoA (MazF antagonist) n=1 Tax=Planomonospora venezuelensis TaxID=1999 RepID=A0A841DL63_PLAVE|nr:phosphotransferase [Planomonospora venezuelensis]MBB5967846.1 Ser/Thr protein kinase RdoA (MazF antagonist) [Planomonospora venezuelensis]GIN03246.1 aminoglycoside phosphotransferase [Planomonospora venezuelensis]
MQAHDLSAGGDVLVRVHETARTAARLHGLPRAEVTLINVSENATFRVDDPQTGARSILRVHRLGYHPTAAIASELAWLEALREEAGVRTPRVIPAPDGSRVLTVPGEPPRDCVMFEFLPGTEPPEDRLVDGFERLGAVTARMHRHARTWRRPAGFTRFHWDYDAALGSESRWGHWRDGLGMEPEALAVLDRLDKELRERLHRFGRGSGRYGLIHADLRLANLLVTGDGPPSVIDFDDCGLGWYLYDLAAALSFIEHHPQVPEMIEAWLRGYRTVTALPAEEEAEIWTFVMFRRLLLVAWIGTHTGVDIAAELGAGYTLGSCELAERYLTGRPPA